MEVVVNKILENETVMALVTTAIVVPVSALGAYFYNRCVNSNKNTTRVRSELIKEIRSIKKYNKTLNIDNETKLF